jgi:hypothetical protein
MAQPADGRTADPAEALFVWVFLSNRMKSSQRLAELRDRIGVRQHATHVSQSPSFDTPPLQHVQSFFSGKR